MRRWMLGRGVAVLAAGLALWPLHGVAEQGFGDLSAPGVERAAPRVKPPPRVRVEPRPQAKPQPKVPARPRTRSQPDAVTAPQRVPAAAATASVPGPDMVSIRAGCFEMGSPPGEKGRDDDERLHRVCVEGFQLGKYEVTVGEFRRFVTATGYRTDAERDTGGNDGCFAYDENDKKTPWTYHEWADWRTPNRRQGNRDDHPVSCVSWNDAVAYIEWLNRAAGGGWRLPTEAEWEYAARAGTQSARYWGDGDSGACRYASVADKGHGWEPNFDCDDGFKWVAPVGRFQSNTWGLKDMLGNVWEWTCSGYDAAYGGAEKRCLSKKEATPLRALRGGSWGYTPRFLRAAIRSRNQPVNRDDGSGFRLARTLTP